MSNRSTLGAAAAAVLLVLAGSAAAAPGDHTPCFLASEWAGWRSPSPNVIYLRVNVNQVYRLDLSAGSSLLQDPDVHLVNRVEGSNWICTPLDLQLELADDHGVFREPLIVKAITRLTPDEVKAIPRKYLP